MKIPANSSSTGWDPSTTYLVDDIELYPSNQTLNVRLTNTGRSRYLCIYHITGPTEKRWFLCELRDPRLTPAMLSTIETEHHTFFFKHFNNNEANYALAHANGAAAYYQIPNGHRKYQIVYGDGLETTEANVHGVRVMLPYENLQDGDRVTLHTSHHFNSSNEDPKVSELPDVLQDLVYMFAWNLPKDQVTDSLEVYTEIEVLQQTNVELALQSIL